MAASELQMIEDYDLLVIVKCWDDAERVEDTIHSAMATSVCKTFCVAVSPAQCCFRLSSVPHFVAQYPWRIVTKPYRTGAQLLGLVIESLRWVLKEFSFSHIVFIDDDTLIIKHGWDREILSLLVSPYIGMMGKYYSIDPRWTRVSQSESVRLTSLLGAKGIPLSYRHGEHIGGPFTVLSRSMVLFMASQGYLRTGSELMAYQLTLTEEVVLVFMCRLAGLDVLCIGDRLELYGETFPLDPRKLSNSILAFHSTKRILFMPQHWPSLEKFVRKHFRDRRFIEGKAGYVRG